MTTNGSSNAAAAAGVNNNNNKSAGNKDANDQGKDPGKDGKDGTSQSLLSASFDPLFYQEMVNTVRLQKTFFSPVVTNLCPSSP